MALQHRAVAGPVPRPGLAVQLANRDEDDEYEDEQRDAHMHRARQPRSQSSAAGLVATGVATLALASGLRYALVRVLRARGAGEEDEDGNEYEDGEEEHHYGEAEDEQWSELSSEDMSGAEEQAAGYEALGRLRQVCVRALFGRG
jgi:flagellar biosynthesis/type III secretory pathway M-ring protein FliF/YscJ